MDERVERLETAEECDQFVINVQKTFPSLAREARRRGVELRAAAHDARTDAEKEALRAVYAYEEALSSKHGRRTRASRTWRMIERHGIIEAVERAVNRKRETSGYAVLIEMGMQDFAFEAVVVRHPELFSPEAVAQARARVEEWTRA